VKNDRIPTPGEARRLLEEGNRRFTGGNQAHPNSGAARRMETTAGQAPFATILTCSDSRVPPEVIFDRGIGDLFVVRVAGNVADDTVTASILYAVEHLFCPLVVVLAHERCGAVTASLAADDGLAGEPREILSLIDTIRNNTPESRLAAGNTAERLDPAIRENAGTVAGQLRRHPAVAKRIETGAVEVAEAFYSLETGRVSWLS